jgi:outer membrane receptor protein involved in Fe transport
LGAGSTLVLLNGHRLAPGDSGGSYVDISMIPLSAVESIQVLTDGASAIYGADAVAGVVNFILRKNFSGAETAVRYGAATRGGAEEVDASQILGTSWDAGNAMLVYEHRETEAVRASQRSFIPDTSGFLSNTIILPNQRSDSAFLTGRQELSPATAVYADTFFSRRNFIQDQAYPGFLSHGTGETKQYGVVLGLTQNLWGDWRGDLAGNYSKVNQGNQLAQFADFFPPEGLIFSTEVDTRLLSLDLRADGSVFAAPGGMARMSLGSSARREEYALTSSAAASVEQQRKVASVYGELFVPLIGIANSSSLARRLELSLATRYEHYDDFGSSFNPKIGVLWAPIEGLNLRSSYATSFRAPSLQQLADANRVYFYLPEGDLSAPDGATNTLIFGALGNPALDAEKSRSYTFGFDFRPAQLQGFALSATYFNIDYRRRIANPPLIGDLTQVFDPAQVAALAPFIDRAPDPAELVRIFAEEQVIDLFGVGAVASDVEAIFDQRLHNIARAKAAGFDVGVDYTRAISQGELGLFLNGDYILHLDSQPASATPSVRLAGTIYNPAKLRLRSGASWSWRGFSSTFSVNYTDDYENNYLTPAGRVASWTTADLQLGYRTGENGPGLLRGLSMTLNAQNLTDRDPPVISGLGFLTNFGYDATNASALGRVLTAQLTKRW